MIGSFTHLDTQIHVKQKSEMSFGVNISPVYGRLRGQPIPMLGGRLCHPDTEIEDSEYNRHNSYTHVDIHTDYIYVYSISVYKLMLININVYM